MFNLSEQKNALIEVEALGELALSCEYLMVIDAHPHLRYLTKGFALPLPSAEDKVEVTLAGGLVTHTSPMAKTDYTHGLTMIETVSGHIMELFESVAYERSINQRGKFDFTIYQGTPEKHTRKWRCTHGLLHGFDAPEIDGENRTQIMMVQGQISYHCFGSEKGNI